jgi:hypothetical protein
MGDWADDILAGATGNQGKDWADQLLEQQSGFRSITDPAAELGPEHVVPGNVAGEAKWSGGSALGDGAYAAAGGVFRGLGVNPADWSPEIANRLQLGEERSPTASGIGNFVGESAIQTAAAPAALARAPVAMGAIGGALSGLGNSSGDLEERVRAAGGGMALGAFGGKAADMVTGRLSSLLARKGGQYGEQQAIHGLMNGGATDGDLTRLGNMRPVQQWYDDAQRLGIKGKPQAARDAANQVVQSAEAQRAAIEARNAGVQIDPNAAAAAVRGANPYPGVPRMDRAAERAAQGVQQAGPSFGAQDLQRSYYGNSANFASGSPNQVMGQRIHGAINNEMEDALNLAEPGAGSMWRQAGRDERTGIELGNIAQKALYRGAAAPITGGDVWTGGLTRLLNNNRHGIQETLYGAGKNVAQGGAKLGSLLEGAPAAFTGAAAGGYAAENAAPPKLDQAALDLLSAGGSELGQWRDQIAAAAGSPAPGAVKDTITRLTMSDPEFRTKILPLLRQHAGGQ